jgi:inorganic pyrophosphatase
MSTQQPALQSPYGRLATFDKESNLNVIIDTPQGSRNKYKYDEELSIFKLGGVLPMGAVFPFDFGSVPGTLGEDGDPVDVLLLMDEPAFVGCLVPSRLIGVIEAEQTQDGKTERNDRLIAVAVDSRNHRDITSIHQLSDSMLYEIEHFFISYNQAKGKEFKPLGRFAVERATKLVEEGMRKAKRET